MRELSVADIAPGSAPLDRLQRWMLRVVTNRDGLEAGLAASRDEGLWPDGADTLADVVPGNDRLTPEEQLHIYAYAYLARLQEALVAESPSLEALLGEERFAALLADYLHDHPSTSTSLDHLGRELAPWLDRRAACDDAPELAAAADMVRVEQGMDRAFDHAPAQPLPADAVASLPPDAWATVRLRFLPGLEVLALDHDVSEALRAARHEEAVPVPPRRPTRVAVYCRDFRRYRRAVDPMEGLLLDALLDGDTLGDALQGVATRPETDVAELLGAVGGWFRGWAEAGWLVAIDR